MVIVACQCLFGDCDSICSTYDDVCIYCICVCKEAAEEIFVQFLREIQIVEDIDLICDMRTKNTFYGNIVIFSLIFVVFLRVCLFLTYVVPIHIKSYYYILFLYLLLVEIKEKLKEIISAHVKASFLRKRMSCL